MTKVARPDLRARMLAKIASAPESCMALRIIKIYFNGRYGEIHLQILCGIICEQNVALWSVVSRGNSLMY